MFLESTINSKNRKGWIEVICGSMFSGKTEEQKAAELAKKIGLIDNSKLSDPRKKN